jgi:uncharacterized membrane protein YgcG
MKNIFRTVLFAILAIVLFKGFSTQQWPPLIIVIVGISILLLSTFVTKAKSTRGSSSYLGGGTSHTDSHCGGGDSGGGCD